MFGEKEDCLVKRKIVLRKEIFFWRKGRLFKKRKIVLENNRENCIVCCNKDYVLYI